MFKQLSVNHWVQNPFSQAKEKVNKLDLVRSLNIRMCPSLSLSAELHEEGRQSPRLCTGHWVCGLITQHQHNPLPRSFVGQWVLASLFSCPSCCPASQFCCSLGPFMLHSHEQDLAERRSFLGAKIPGATKGAIERGIFPGCSSIIILPWFMSPY